MTVNRTDARHMFETRCLSSLTKVFADEPLTATPWRRATALSNERYSFQVAYWSDVLRKPLTVEVDSDLAPLIVTRSVGLVPSELPCHSDHDEDVLRTTPGLYPDPLYRIDPETGIVAFPAQWRSVWLTVDLNESVAPGGHAVTVRFRDGSRNMLGAEVFTLEVIPALLPPQRLIHTEWLHADCIADYYHVDVWSDRHWDLIDAFVRTAVRNGINMILTPLFTPPLDTAIGRERRTVQLVDVERSGGEFRFDFTKLSRWIEMCRRAGVEYFEFSHLFTQWGAKHAPKIVVTIDGKPTRLFGWDTDATGEPYAMFLDQFLPQLVSLVRRSGLEAKSYFHVSDEPSLSDVAQYRECAALLRRHLSGFPVIDAVSDYQLYADGVVKNPIPSSDHLGSFIEHGVKPLWTYYCVAQNKKVPNRFFHMPSARNRILGTLMYRYSVDGLLHWGYNFYNEQYSIRPIDPFRNTDGGYFFPSGDAFAVYPGNGEVIESLRLVVLHEGIQDLRALELLESIVGRTSAIAIVEEGLGTPISFVDYPRGEEWLLNLRERINAAIVTGTRALRRDKE
jgi:hypothetical protein